MPIESTKIGKMPATDNVATRDSGDDLLGVTVAKLSRARGASTM